MCKFLQLFYEKLLEAGISFVQFLVQWFMNILGSWMNICFIKIIVFLHCIQK